MDRIPDRMLSLPRDDEDRPIPWWVCTLTSGGRAFRAADPDRHVRALRHDLCWCCGKKLGKHKAFVLSPASAYGQRSTLPAQHRDCAMFAARACPYLTTAGAIRDNGAVSLGVCVVVLSTTSYLALGNGAIFTGRPLASWWFCGGTETDPDAVVPWLVERAPAIQDGVDQSGDPDAATAVAAEYRAVGNLLGLGDVAAFTHASNRRTAGQTD